VVGELAGLPFVSDLALSGDSGLLYAAVEGAHALVAVGTDTLRETARYPVGADISPSSVAPVGGKLWFGYLKGDNGNFGSVDPADDTVRLPTGLSAERLQAAPSVHAAAAVGYVPVKADGTSTAELTGAHPLGVRFRVRSAYLEGDSGDSANHTTYGAWKYFLFQQVNAE
jgi:hypothetical protein